MVKTTIMDIYVKGKIVFSYVRERGNFNSVDVKIDIHEGEQGV